MSAPSDLRTLVLHGLRLKGFAEPPAVAEVVDVSEDDAKAELEELLGKHLVQYRDGRMSGFTLTSSGRLEHTRLVREELDRYGARDAVEAAYKRFLGRNGDLLAVCTAWQLKGPEGDQVVNDHTDPEYDRAVIDQLAAIHAHIEPVCDELAAALDRYAFYGPRLARALEHLREGDLDWFTKPMIPSYHTIWFELHEDLLATLGIERGHEVIT